MKGEDIKAGSKPILSKSKGRIAPAVAANVVIEIRLIPTADAIKGPSPCHHAKGKTTNIIKIPSKAPVIASFITTVTDIAGVFIYLSTANWLLNSSIL